MLIRSLLSICWFALVCVSTLAAQSPTPIPKNLDEAHGQLMKLFPPQELKQIKLMNTEDEMIRYHMGFGTGLRNQWQLWGDSPLTRYFNKLGIHQAEDMSDTILKTFWCKLHKQPFRLEQRVVYYENYWRAEANPVGGSPKDGAKIVWLITESSGKNIVHLGISTTDHSYWRYVFGESRGIEPANAKDTHNLDELRKTWRSVGTKFEDMVHP